MLTEGVGRIFSFWWFPSSLSDNYVDFLVCPILKCLNNVSYKALIDIEAPPVLKITWGISMDISQF